MSGNYVGDIELTAAHMAMSLLTALLGCANVGERSRTYPGAWALGGSGVRVWGFGISREARLESPKP